MKCTFYRPENTNIKEFDNIIGKLRADLRELDRETADALKTYHYVYRLLKEAQPLENNPDMMFWGLDNPRSMPGDSRVEYFYKPSYMATAFLMKSAILFPKLMEEDGLFREYGEECDELFRKVMSKAMLGCTGRGFMGSGYDSVEGLFDTLGIFADGWAVKFIKKYPDVCPEFTKLFDDSVSMIRNKVDEGEWRDGWGTDYIPKASKVIALIDAE